MGGGHMQIAAFGEQDIYLVGNPQVTFFKIVYRRHTNFAIDSVEQPFANDADFGKKVEARVARNGDLLGKIYLEVVLPALNQTQDGATWQGWVNSIGHALIESTSIEIGGQILEKQYPEWMEIWSELTNNDTKKNSYNAMIGKYETDVSLESNATATKRLYVPLQFWFCRNPGLAIPLVALQYHEVKINIQFRQLSELTRSDVEITTAPQDSAGDTATFTSATLYCDYVYLDNDERTRFGQNSHEYLIEQVQFLGNKEVTASTASQRVKLQFNNPVKEIMWAVTTDANAAINTLTGNRLMNFSSTSGADTFATMKVEFNGTARFSPRNADYFRTVQPHDVHSGIPRKHCYCYSFGYKPEEHQPTGQVNMSRLDTVSMMFTYTSSDVVSSLMKVYAINYNVLRFVSGMAGLSF